MGKIYFSIEEAQDFVQKNKGKISRIIQLFEETEAMKFIKVEYLDDDPDTLVKLLELNKNYFKALAELHEGLYDLHLQGCMVKDLGSGLIDFYSKNNDKDILLCWKHGEKDLKYWHTVEAGFNGRQNVDVLKKEYQKKLEKLI